MRLDPTGERGVAVGSAEELRDVLDGVMTDLAPVALDAGFLGPTCADWLAAAAKASPAAPLALNLDPLSAFARNGVSPGPIEAHLIAASHVAARLAETHPKASLFLASGGIAHEAGASPAWELAVGVTSALAYARTMTRAGIAQDEAFRRIVLSVSVDGDVLASIVKLRAARVLWDKITTACGVEDRARLQARSSDRMLTRADPWTNLVRLTSAGFAAAVGGADAVILANFTDAIGLPSPLARRLARNTQLVLMEEAHVGAVADPAAGAWAVEAQTDELARRAWSCIASIEAAGGIVDALRSGAVAEAVAVGRTGPSRRHRHQSDTHHRRDGFSRRKTHSPRNRASAGHAGRRPGPTASRPRQPLSALCLPSASRNSRHEPFPGFRHPGLRCDRRATSFIDRERGAVGHTGRHRRQDRLRPQRH